MAEFWIENSDLWEPGAEIKIIHCTSWMIDQMWFDDWVWGKCPTDL